MKMIDDLGTMWSPPPAPVVERVRPRLLRWLVSNFQHTTASTLDFVMFCRDACQKELDEMTGEFGDHLKFPKVPYGLLFDAGSLDLPDVWVMGWRKGQRAPEATTIHDHGPSAAAILAVKGDIVEVHYDVDRAQWAAGIDPLPCKSGKLVHLHPGEALTVPVPYIHRMLDEHCGAEGFSIHGYYPALHAQKSYDIVHSNPDTALLYLDGGWKQEDEHA